MEIAYNRAYQPPILQNEEPFLRLTKTNLAGQHSSIRSMEGANQLWQELAEESNDLDWLKDLPELNFSKAIQDFIEQLKQNLKLGLSLG